ncbi:hypothetical protein MRX96_044455 [Rhipicephalus microplus]
MHSDTAEGPEVRGARIAQRTIGLAAVSVNLTVHGGRENLATRVALTKEEERGGGGVRTTSPGDSSASAIVRWLRPAESTQPVIGAHAGS